MQDSASQDSVSGEIESSEPIKVELNTWELLRLGEHKDIGPIIREINYQWTRNRACPSSAPKFGDMFMYFDVDRVLHMHMTARGPYVSPTGDLERVPDAHLPHFLVGTHYDAADSKAGIAAKILVSMPHGVDANDTRWDAIASILEDMALEATSG